MSSHWRETLNEYVRMLNQFEVHCSIDSLLPLLLDEQYKDMQRKRLSRFKERSQERNLKLKKSETRMKILKFQNGYNQKDVEIQLKRYYLYEVNHKRFEEERIEKQRIILKNEKGEWLIQRVEQPVPERTYCKNPPIATVNPHIKAQPLSLSVQNLSAPYMNEQLLNRASSKKSYRYQRLKVKSYADAWWEKPNPDFRAFNDDCTNFVSQCIYAGGASMNYTKNRTSGWWYHSDREQDGWSFSWTVSQCLKNYLLSKSSGLRAETVEDPEQLQVGDVIFYDWDGDSKFQHSAIVTGKDDKGQPLVNARTVNSKHRYWDYKDSYAWSNKTKYSFCHIYDTL
ncbi:amidase domain-containing protein [Chengkuizengella axinellae]|uniref:Amidase domain-containing protein n=1 Tax=Chengkuizengella axinellae TaxID=3064388 RepID=A0ABT9J0J8_9BACL|nr:amidase domain-containing protein [Chengkuizengella sp. 2205SS18-9]MDP5275008.1 amidase domain-containing protein [Chengkuizengella sp. 2205SS18-9]